MSVQNPSALLTVRVMFGGAVVVCCGWLTKTNCGNSNNRLAIYNTDSNTGSSCFLVNLIKLTPG